jgi:flagellar assembly protein FliH
LSRIIKSSQMQLSRPIMIDLIELTQTSNNELILPDNEVITSPLDLEKQELERVRQERESILRETEKMVMDLLDKAREEAKNIIANAREEAEVIKQGATRESNHIKEKICQEAYEEGKKRAQVEAEAEWQKVKQQVQDILEDAKQEKLAMFRSSESDMINLIIAIAEKVIAGELQTNHNIIINVVREALQYLDQSGNINVYVNPQEIDSILEAINKGDFTNIGNGTTNLEVKADERILIGGAILESEAGIVDARIETRTNNVLNIIREVAANE